MPASTFKVLVWLLFAALGGGAIWAATNITGPSFDPLGPEAAPYALGGVLLFLLVLDAVKKGPANTGEAGDTSLLDGAKVVSVVGLSALFCVLCFVFRVPFSLIAAAYVPAIFFLLAESRPPRALALAAVIGLVVGFGGEALFTKVFFVDLPALW